MSLELTSWIEARNQERVKFQVGGKKSLFKYPSTIRWIRQSTIRINLMLQLTPGNTFSNEKFPVTTNHVTRTRRIPSPFGTHVKERNMHSVQTNRLEDTNLGNTNTIIVSEEQICLFFRVWQMKLTIYDSHFCPAFITTVMTIRLHCYTYQPIKRCRLLYRLWRNRIRKNHEKTPKISGGSLFQNHNLWPPFRYVVILTRIGTRWHHCSSDLITSFRFYE